LATGENKDLERGLMIVAGLVPVYPGLLQDVLGLGLFALALLMQYQRRKSAGT
jgi:UPF0716 family protein affecting phage T7 exclusion